MQNEKFCFNKGVGLIALVGIVLITLVLVSQTLMSTQTSTSTRAGWDNPRPNKKQIAAILQPTPVTCKSGTEAWFGTCVSSTDKFCPTQSVFMGCDGSDADKASDTGYIQYQTRAPADTLPTCPLSFFSYCRPKTIISSFNSDNYCKAVTGSQSARCWQSGVAGFSTTDIKCPLAVGDPFDRVIQGTCFKK